MRYIQENDIYLKIFITTPESGEGRADSQLPLQTTTLKEALEETGLLIRTTTFLSDFLRIKAITRFYLAQHTGGTTATDMGLGSRAVLSLTIN